MTGGGPDFCASPKSHEIDDDVDLETVNELRDVPIAQPADVVELIKGLGEPRADFAVVAPDSPRTSVRALLGAARSASAATRARLHERGEFCSGAALRPSTLC